MGFGQHTGHTQDSEKQYEVYHDIIVLVVTVVLPVFTMVADSLVYHPSVNHYIRFVNTTSEFALPCRYLSPLR